MHKRINLTPDGSLHLISDAGTELIAEFVPPALSKSSVLSDPATIERALRDAGKRLTARTSWTQARGDLTGWVMGVSLMEAA